MRLRAISPGQAQLLGIVYDAFRATAEWPTAGYVDSVLDRTYSLDTDNVLVIYQTDSSALCQPKLGFRAHRRRLQLR